MVKASEGKEDVRTTRSAPLSDNKKGGLQDGGGGGGSATFWKSRVLHRSISGMPCVFFPSSDFGFESSVLVRVYPVFTAKADIVNNFWYGLGSLFTTVFDSVHVGIAFNKL